MRWLACGLLLVMGVCAPAVAEPLIEHPPAHFFDPVNVPAHITMIRTGWNAESFAIETMEPISNPAGCPTADGYVTDSTQSGYHTYYAAALLAFAERATVIVVVAAVPLQCVSGRPKLIGINIVR